MDEDTLVALLIGDRLPRITEMEQEQVVPPFLAWPYARESAARQAAERESLSPRLAAALVRAAYSDIEEDVRAAARHTLILRNEVIGDIVHFSLILDADPYVCVRAPRTSPTDRSQGRAIPATDREVRCRRPFSGPHPVAAGQPSRAHIR